jgi:hypothetical protein
LVGTALIAVAVLGAPTTASAADEFPTAYNTKTQLLTNKPESGMDASCASRRISLIAGDYDWEQTLALGSRSNLRLGSGMYTWEDCLYPDDGFYVQQTTLNPDTKGWETISLTDWVGGGREAHLHVGLARRPDVLNGNCAGRVRPGLEVSGRLRRPRGVSTSGWGEHVVRPRRPVSHLAAPCGLLLGAAGAVPGDVDFHDCCPLLLDCLEGEDTVRKVIVGLRAVFYGQGQEPSGS